MGILYSQASFKNSRIASRKPTTASSASKYELAVSGIHEIVVANPSRTYITIKNTSETETIRYGYTNNPNLATEGFELKPNDAADLEAPSAIWATNVTGSNPVEIHIDQGEG